jgi:hypothetical protein
MDNQSMIITGTILGIFVVLPLVGALVAQAINRFQENRVIRATRLYGARMLLGVGFSLIICGFWLLLSNSTPEQTTLCKYIIGFQSAFVLQLNLDELDPALEALGQTSPGDRATANDTSMEPDKWKEVEDLMIRACEQREIVALWSLFSFLVTAGFIVSGISYGAIDDIETKRALLGHH